MKVSREIVMKIWNDDEGACLEIGQDEDGLGVQIRTGNDKGSKDWFGDVNITLPGKEFALSLGEALVDYVAHHWPEA